MKPTDKQITITKTFRKIMYRWMKSDDIENPDFWRFSEIDELKEKGIISSQKVYWYKTSLSRLLLHLKDK